MKLQEIEKVLGRKLPNGDEDIASISSSWHAFFENPTKYADTPVVAMVNQFVDENMQKQATTVEDEVELSRGYSVVMIYTGKEGVSNLYDILLYKGSRKVCKLSSGCIGGESNTLMKHDICTMKRVLYLVDGIDMAYNNVLAYSKTYGMDEPEDGYENMGNIEKEEAKMLETWLAEIFNDMSENIKTALMNEFSEYATVHD